MLAIIAAAVLAAVSPGFRVTVLGAQGGLVDGDLSAFLVEGPGKKALLVDAGTFVNGIEVARKKGAFTELSTGAVLKDRIGPVLLTHPHYDHIMGLVIGSPDDVPRRIFALPATIDALRAHVFNNRMWPNFSNEGEGAIGRYTYVRMPPGAAVHVEEAGVDVTALPLAHAGGTSTAFIIDAGNAAIVYCGDTGPDFAEHSDRLAKVLAKTAALVRAKKLAGLFLESSYPSVRENGKLFGHLTPRHVMDALRALARDVDRQHPEGALRGVTVVITHIKPALDGSAPRSVIVDELRKMTDGGVRILVPQQGDVLMLTP